MRGWRGASRLGRAACVAQKIADISTCQQFSAVLGLVAPGRLLLLRWCACRFARFWELFSVVRDIFLGSVLNSGVAGCLGLSRPGVGCALGLVGVVSLHHLLGF